MTKHLPALLELVVLAVPALLELMAFALIGALLIVVAGPVWALAPAAAYLLLTSLELGRRR